MSEPSLGELGRLIQSVKGDLREDIQQIHARLDQMVSRDVYAAEKAAMAKEISDLKESVKAINQGRKEDADRVTQTRRYLFASVIIPIVGIVLPLYMAMKGAGS